MQVQRALLWKLTDKFCLALLLVSVIYLLLKGTVFIGCSSYAGPHNMMSAVKSIGMKISCVVAMKILKNYAKNV